MSRKVAIGIVSHGHSDVIKKLFAKLFATPTTADFVCTLVLIANQGIFSMDAKCLQKLGKGLPRAIKLYTLANDSPKGFAENQNQCFSKASEDFFCVLNPDINVQTIEFSQLLEEMISRRLDLICPTQVNLDGQILDSFRSLVTPWSLIKRYFFGHRFIESVDASVDWYNGAFMLFRSEAFKAIGGFDERYFMYCEDVDICLRMRIAGFSIGHSNIKVIHDTRRSTLKSWQHFRWHLRSMIRLWTSSVYWRYLWKRKSLQKIA